MNKGIIRRNQRCLEKKMNDIDNDPSLMYDSLVIMFSSRKLSSEAGKIYDCDGEIVQRTEILEIINGSRYFKGKPKIR
ncbi:hypothetical protein AM593_10446, partial [Mytilus galloprovincialis]